MKYLLLSVCAFITICLSGCGEVREVSTQVEELKAQLAGKNAEQAKVVTSLKAATSKLSASEQARASALDLIADGKRDLAKLDELDKAKDRDNAKSWRNLFDIIGLGFTVLAIAAYAFALFQQWPIKWLAAIFGCVGIGLFAAGQLYVWIVDYRSYILGGGVLIGIVTAYWYIHTKSSFINQIKDKLPSISLSDLQGSARRTALRWKLVKPITTPKAA